MSGPLPPYLGSWEQLISELLRNPFLGSPWPPHHQLLASMRPRVGDELAIDSGPWPWAGPVKKIAAFLVSQISLKQLASSLPPEQAGPLISSTDRSIAEEVDDICGTKVPGWHWPGPPPWIFPIASELAVVANTFQDGNLRSEVLKVASQILRTGLGAPLAAPKTVVKEKKAA